MGENHFHVRCASFRPDGFSTVMGGNCFYLRCASSRPDRFFTIRRKTRFYLTDDRNPILSRSTGAFWFEGPTLGFSSAAGRFAEARRASARDGALKNAQVVGRASGVCCERGWAAGLAAGRRAGAHDNARVGAAIPAGVPSPARRAPRDRRRPPNAACKKRPTLRRRDPAPTPRPWRHATRMAGPRWG